MTFANCPKCGSSDVTTAGVCANCGWIRFPQAMGAGESKEAIYNLVGEIEIKVTGKALLDDYKRLLFENNSLTARIAELEEKQRWIPVSEGLPETKGHYMTVVVDGFDDSRSVETLRYFGDGDWFTWSDWYVVTHWKEKPELPNDTQTQTIVYGKGSEE